jgi:hypothetical protein
MDPLHPTEEFYRNITRRQFFDLSARTMSGAMGRWGSPGSPLGRRPARRLRAARGRAAGPAPFPPQGQACDLHAHVGRAEPDRPVRPQADACETGSTRTCPRLDPPGAAAHDDDQRAEPVPGRALDLPVLALPQQPGRRLGQRADAAHGIDRERAVLHQVDAHRRDQPRARDHLLPDREPAAGARVVRRVDELRAGQRQRQPALAFVVLITQGFGNMQALSARFWGSGFLPGEHQGVHLRSGGSPVLYLKDPPGIDRADRRRMLDALGELNEAHRVRTLRPRDRHPDGPVRDGLPHADVGPRAHRFLRRGPRDARDVRARGPQAGLLRRQLPARPEAERARRAVRPALHAGLGRPRQPARRDPPAVQRRRPAPGGTDPRSQAAAACSTTRWSSGRASSGAPSTARDASPPRPTDATTTRAASPSGSRAGASSPASLTAPPTSTPTTSPRTP